MSNNQLDDNLKAAACEIRAKNGNSSKPVLWMLFMNINKNYVVFSTQNAKKDFFEF